MSPTLLEGVVIIIVLVVAWQIGSRLAPIILRALARAINQFNGNSPQQDTPQKLLTDKEHPDDQP
jgi:hypothetical protein